MRPGRSQASPDGPGTTILFWLGRGLIEKRNGFYRSTEKAGADAPGTIKNSAERAIQLVRDDGGISPILSARTYVQIKIGR